MNKDEQNCDVDDKWNLVKKDDLAVIIHNATSLNSIRMKLKHNGIIHTSKTTRLD